MEEEWWQSLPRAVAQSWGCEKEPQRGPKRELSVKQIVEAAVVIADRDGLAAVSMSRVAATFGFTTMSLYRYIASKEDLLALMQDAVCDVPMPPMDGEDWRGDMREYVRVCVDVFRQHPWFGDLPISSVPLMPNNLKMIDWVLGAMRKFRLSDFEKMSFVLLLSSYARACGTIRRDMDRALREGTTAEAFSGTTYSAALRQLVTPDRFPDLHPVIQSGAYTDENPENNPVGDDMDFGLERILDGMEHYLKTRRAL